MTAGKCATCKWWGRSWKGECDRVQAPPDGGIRFELVATAADDTDLDMRLVTGPDFGCVLHEVKL